MRIRTLLSERPPGAPTLLILLSVQALAGLAGAALIAVLTHAAEAAGQSSMIGWVALALGTLAVFGFAQRYATRKTTARIERTIHNVRIRLIGKLIRVDLQTFEQIGREHLLACVEKDMKIISTASTTVIAAGQSVMLFVCATAYLAYLSPLAFVISVVVILLGVTLHFIRMRAIVGKAQQALNAENGLFGLVGHMVGGFKELKLHQQRRREIYGELVEASDRATSLNQEAFGVANDHLILMQSILYVLLGLIVFVLPLAGWIEPFLLIRILAVILFLNGPLNHFVGILPMYAQADAAARNIGELEQRLDKGGDADAEAIEAPPAQMHSIVFRDARFAYAGASEQAFEVGPIDLTLEQGQLIFITGGNGSGKSTFLKLLTGLQRPTHGEVLLNGTPLDTPAALAAYRGLFSAVFADYHLFPTLYGTTPPAPDVAAAMLERLALSGKTRLEGRAFTPLNLSTGQRKRLAHLVTLFEDRQVYVFDEWAADQDPGFRRWFYCEELQRLKGLGKTVIAVTHDEQYFGYGDRWLHFEEGRCEERGPDTILAAAGTPPALH